MLEEATQTLAAFAADLAFDDIPRPVQVSCKDLLLDALACALAGHEGEETSQVRALAAGLATSAETTVIGDGRMSLAGATLMNSYLITALAMCDVHRATMMHVTPQIVPAALSVGERDGCSGRALLTAIAAGAECALRIGVSLDYPAFRAKGWHTPGVVGPFAAACALGKLLAFDRDTMARAFGLAGSRAAGTFAALGTAGFKFHQFSGAVAGLMAALAAQQGFSGPRNVLTVPDGGLWTTYSNGGRPDALTANLGSRWELLQIGLRPWPLASTLQGMATALFELTERPGLVPDNVRAVRVKLSKASFDVHAGAARYKGKVEALFSAHYAAAAIMHDRMLTLAQFEPARFDDPRLRRFAAEQVEIGIGAELKGAEAVVHVESTDGTICTAQCADPKGSPANPLSAADVQAKFRACAAPRLSSSQIEEVVSTVADLENLPSVAALAELLRRR